MVHIDWGDNVFLWICLNRPCRCLRSTQLIKMMRKSEVSILLYYVHKKAGSTVETDSPPFSQLLESEIFKIIVILLAIQIVKKKTCWYHLRITSGLWNKRKKRRNKGRRTESNDNREKTGKDSWWVNDCLIILKRVLNRGAYCKITPLSNEGV